MHVVQFCTPTIFNYEGGYHESPVLVTAHIHIPRLKLRLISCEGIPCKQVMVPLRSQVFLDELERWL
jgi:hypothetical protein